MDEVMGMIFVGVVCFIVGVLFRYNVAPKETRILFWAATACWVIVEPITLASTFGVWCRSAYDRIKERDANAK